MPVPPVDVLRLSLHPDGLAPRVRNYRQWRSHILHRLDESFQISGDRELQPAFTGRGERIAVPFEFDSDCGPLSFISTTTVFGTAAEVALSELTIETFLPADRETAVALHEAWRAAVRAGEARLEVDFEADP